MPRPDFNASLLLVTLLLATACSQSQEAAPVGQGPAESGTPSDPVEVTAAVRAAVDAHWIAIKNTDTAAIASHHTTDMTFFGPESDHLVSLNASAPETAALWQKFAGAKATWTPRDVKVQAFDNVAVASFFNDGSVTYPDGRVDKRTRRVTEVWVRQPDGSWKEAHHHDSPLGN